MKRGGKGGGKGSVASAAAKASRKSQAQRRSSRNARPDVLIKVGAAALLCAALGLLYYGLAGSGGSPGGDGAGDKEVAEPFESEEEMIQLGEYEQKLLKGLADGSLQRKLKQMQEELNLPPAPPPPSGPFQANQKLAEKRRSERLTAALKAKRASGDMSPHTMDDVHKFLQEDEAPEALNDADGEEGAVLPEHVRRRNGDMDPPPEVGSSPAGTEEAEALLEETDWADEVDAFLDKVDPDGELTGETDEVGAFLDKVDPGGEITGET